MDTIDLSDRTVLVTGATDGLGRGLALELARHGASVLLHGRDAERLRDTQLAVSEAATGAAPRTYLADFASLAEVERMAEEIVAAQPRIDVLISNAGIGMDIPGGGERMESADGHELRFAVNYLAGWALTRGLLPTLDSSRPARIVNVSSAGQAAIDFDDVMLERDYSGVRAYCQSKLAQILSTRTLAEELDGRGVTVTCLHPATYMPTKIVPSPVSSLEEGVDATLRLAVDPALEGVSGVYFNGTNVAWPNPQADDPEARRLLEELSRELAG